MRTQVRKFAWGVADKLKKAAREVPYRQYLRDMPFFVEVHAKLSETYISFVQPGYDDRNIVYCPHQVKYDDPQLRQHMPHYTNDIRKGTCAGAVLHLPLYAAAPASSKYKFDMLEARVQFVNYLLEACLNSARCFVLVHSKVSPYWDDPWSRRLLLHGGVQIVDLRGFRFLVGFFSGEAARSLQNERLNALDTAQWLREIGVQCCNLVSQQLFGEAAWNFDAPHVLRNK